VSIVEMHICLCTWIFYWSRENPVAAISSIFAVIILSVEIEVAHIILRCKTKFVCHINVCIQKNKFFITHSRSIFDFKNRTQKPKHVHIIYRKTNQYISL